MNDEKDEWSEKKTDIWGNEYTQKYNQDGDKAGWSETKTDIWGNPYTQDYDQDGTKASWSESKSDIFGNEYSQSYDQDNNKTSWSQGREDIWGNTYRQESDQENNRTGWSENKEDIFGEKYRQHYTSKESASVAVDGKSKNEHVVGGSGYSHSPASGSRGGLIFIVVVAIVGGFLFVHSQKSKVPQGSANKSEQSLTALQIFEKNWPWWVASAALISGNNQLCWQPNPQMLGGQLQWMRDQKTGCELLGQIPAGRVNKVKSSLTWSGACKNGRASGSGRVVYYWDETPIFIMDFSKERGAVLDNGTPRISFDRDQVMYNPRTCAEYISGGLHRRSVAASVASNIDLANPLIAAAIASWVETSAAAQCDPTKKIWETIVEIYQDNKFRVCALNPNNYLDNSRNNRFNLTVSVRSAIADNLFGQSSRTYYQPN